MFRQAKAALIRLFYNLLIFCDEQNIEINDLFSKQDGTYVTKIAMEEIIRWVYLYFTKDLLTNLEATAHFVKLFLSQNIETCFYCSRVVQVVLTPHTLANRAAMRCQNNLYIVLFIYIDCVAVYTVE
jgi:hypothetical protein